MELGAKYSLNIYMYINKQNLMLIQKHLHLPADTTTSNQLQQVSKLV